MALKHQLQCHVFRGTPDMAAQITPLIISLQTAAVNLQIIEVTHIWIYLVHIFYHLSITARILPR